jgi:hypothetical protein
MKMHKYPKIGQFRNVLKDLKMDEDTKDLKEVEFIATTKVHGTNAAVVYDASTGELWAQSRNNVITLENDNAGFAAWVDNNKEVWVKEISDFIQNTTLQVRVVVYGEWFGKGIQSGVAVTQIEEKHFMIFDIRLITQPDTPAEIKSWAGPKAIQAFQPKIDNVFNAYNIGFQKLTVDMDMPQKALPQVESSVMAVEAMCPVGKSFNVEGTGEGLVYKFYINSKMFPFKAKGEAHQVSRKGESAWLIEKAGNEITVNKRKPSHLLSEWLLTNIEREGSFWFFKD